MHSVELFPMRRAGSVPNVPQKNDLLIVGFFSKLTQFVSLPSFRSWSFVQITAALLYLQLVVYLFLQDILAGENKGANLNEQLGRIDNTVTSIFLSLYISCVYLSTHDLRVEFLASKWLDTIDVNVRNYFKQLQRKLVLVLVALGLYAILLSASLVLEHYMSVECHFCLKAGTDSGSKWLAVVVLVGTLLFASTLSITVFLAIVDLVLLHHANTIFAVSLCNQLESLNQNDAEARNKLLRLSAAYKPLLGNGSRMYSRLMNSFFTTYPCIAFHVFQCLLPHQYKTSATLSQLCFPTACLVLLVFLSALAKRFGDWKAEYHRILTRVFSQDKKKLEEAISIVDYPENYCLAWKALKFNFLLKGAMVLTLVALTVGAVGTMMQMFANNKLYLR